MASPSHTARRYSWRTLAGVFVLAVTLSAGALSPAVTTAQTGGGYIGYDTPEFSAGQSVVVQTDDGGGLSLRNDASVDAEKLGALGDGAVVRVVEGPYYDEYGNGWYLVTDGSIRAFAYAGFLAASGSTASVYADEAASSTSSGYLGYQTPEFQAGEPVVVQTDDGGGLSLRLEPSSTSEKLSAAADGSALTIIAGPYTDSAGNGWYLVTNGPLRAYAFAGFLVAGSGASATSASSSATSGSAGNLGFDTPQFSPGQTVTVHTDTGGGLSLRLEPSTTAEKLDAARDGDALTVVEGPVYDESNNGWYLVTNGPLRAWAYAGFLVSGGQASASSSTSSSGSGSLGLETPSFAEGQLIVVQTDDGGGLSLRMEPSVTADKLVAFKDGTSLRVVQGPVYDDSGNGWYLVTDGSIRAYAIAGFLAPSGTTASSGSTSGSASPSSGNLGFETPQFSEGQTVAVQTDTGGGLSLRMEPNTSSEQLMALKEGATLTIVMGPEIDSSGNGWYLVTNGSIRAFAYGGFLVASSTPSSSSASSSGTASAASFSIGDYVTTSGVTNVRNGATANGSLLGTFRGGDVVEITDGPFYDRNQEAWYYIVGDSVQGFAKGEFLVGTAAPSGAGSSGFIYPLAKYTFSQDYGCSSLSYYSYNPAWGCAVHNGIDLSAPYGTPIMAAAAGTVEEAGWCNCGLGYYVKIDHGNGLATYYGHMQSMPYVAVGESVSQGETIGPVGSTGLSTGPHTHFMVQKNGVTVDPMDYL